MKRTKVFWLSALFWFAGCAKMPKATGIASETFTGVVSMSVPVTGSVDVESVGPDRGGARTGWRPAQRRNPVPSQSAPATPTGWGRGMRVRCFADPTTGWHSKRVDEMCTLFDFSNVPAQIVIQSGVTSCRHPGDVPSAPESVDIGAAFATAKADLKRVVRLRGQAPPVDVVDASRESM